MLHGTLRSHAVVGLAYVCVAVAFFWPLPLHLSTALPGPPESDTGIYVWNLWLFRHEILAHGGFPLFTSEILGGTSDAIPLTLHNYTTFANVVAFPLISVFGTVATFNILMIGSLPLAAFTMFLYARRRTGDAGSAFVAGLLFGFSPFMTARSVEHFSLVQAAPLPLFGLLMLRIFEHPRLRYAIAAGLVVAWAFLCDPYYAVYCLLIALFMVGYSVVAFEPRPQPARQVWISTLLTLTLVCVAGLIIGMILRGGTQTRVFGRPVGMRHLYTPMLIFSFLLACRVWIALRRRITLVQRFSSAHATALASAVAVCALTLAPVLVAMTSAAGRPWRGPKVFWRSSEAGIDAAAWLVPNPYNPWIGDLSAAWLAQRPYGIVENVASVPWVVIGTLALAAAVAGFRGTRGWWCFTGVFALLSLGPFVRIAGVNTYIPTPWTLLRYLPVIGAARMPTRMTVLVMLGLSMLTALAVRDLRRASGRPGFVLAGVTILLMLELVPAPRRLHSAAVPEIFRIIAADPRPVRVMHLPFGLRDGLSSNGVFSAAYQYYQTVHEKPLMGGYLSRLPPAAISSGRRDAVLKVLLRLSEGKESPVEAQVAAAVRGPELVRRVNLGYVVVDTRAASPALVEFASNALWLEQIATDGPFVLYRTRYNR